MANQRARGQTKKPPHRLADETALLEVTPLWGISINLASQAKILFQCAQLHGPPRANNAQRMSNRRRATYKGAKWQRRSNDSHERITGFQHNSPSADRLATRIPRGKKFSIPTINVRARGRLVFSPASTRERIGHHSWEHVRPLKGSLSA